MADVTVKYKGSTIAEMSKAGTKTLNTSGKYCEDNIKVEYAPKSKSYEITLAKASGWVLLTTLDADVLEHINDASFRVALCLLDEWEYISYRVTYASASNMTFGVTSSGYNIYGNSMRNTSATAVQNNFVFYPANKTDTTISLGGAQFRLDNGKYYLRPVDGYLVGTYRLTFTW